MSNNSWYKSNDWGNNEDWDNDNTSDVSVQDPTPVDTSFLGSRAMSPEARNILKHMKSMGITQEEPEWVTIKPIPMPKVDSEYENPEPMTLFRMSSNQDESQYLTPNGKNILRNIYKMGIAENGPEEPAFKMEPVPASIPTPQDIPAPETFHVGSQPTEPEAVDETAQFFKQVAQAFEKRKAETAEKIAHYNQHGWPTYNSGTDTNLPAAPVETVQNALLVKRDGAQDRPDDILLAQARDSGTTRDISTGLSLQSAAAQVGEQDINSDPMQRLIKTLFGEGAQGENRGEEKKPDPVPEDNKPEEKGKIPAQKNSQKEQEPHPLNGPVNDAIKEKRRHQNIQTSVDIKPIQDWEANEKTGYVPPGPRSGVSAGIGIDFAHHTPESLVKMGVDPKLAHSEKLRPYLKPNENTLGPRGDQAKKTLKEKGLELTDAEADNLNQAILTDNLDRVITSYERHREKNPNAKKFDELPPEVQTVILSRYHHRSSRWNELNQSGIADSNFFKALMQGGDDPDTLKATLADALQADANATTNGDIKGRLLREVNYLKGKKKTTSDK